MLFLQKVLYRKYVKNFRYTSCFMDIDFLSDKGIGFRDVQFLFMRRNIFYVLCFDTIQWNMNDAVTNIRKIYLIKI